MNSVRYKVVNPWGLHARPAAAVVSIAQTCARGWEVIAAKQSEEVDAKSIMGLLLLAAGYGSEIEFMSLMPDDQWIQFTASLEALFFVVDENGEKANAYLPIEQMLRQFTAGNDVPCSRVQSYLAGQAMRYRNKPMFARCGQLPDSSSDAQHAAAFSFDNVDVFISYDSADFAYAVKIYDALIAQGLNVFLAGVSIARTGTSDFTLAIERALNAANSMVIVATDPAHLDGGWVRAEWSTFLNEMRAGRKMGNLVTVRPAHVLVDAFPLMLRTFHSEEVSETGLLSEAGIERLLSLLVVKAH